MGARTESPEAYFRRPDVVSEYASFDFLLPPERTILELLAPRLAASRMLDLGVGAGRTTLHFAPLVREYVGIDISPRMIEACNRRFAGSFRNATFATGDARDLGSFEPASFDFVLFSFNGIDTVGGREDRRAAIGEIHRVCRPGAHFGFSSSNLRFALFRASALSWLWNFVRSEPGAAVRHPGRLRHVVADSRRWSRLNPRLRDLAAAREGTIVEERPRYELSAGFYASPADRIRSEKYYIDPDRQVEQLAAAGFRDVRAFLPDGSPIDGPVAPAGAPVWWLYYLCRRED